MLALLSPSISASSEYSPIGFYDTDNLVLENGFRLILKPRGEVRNTSIRLVVGVGTGDFPCGRKETPHFLEHLLFTGTSKHTETELDDLIDEHGGSWNATTGKTRTTYQVDIFSKYTGLAIETLHEILTDSTISEKNVELSRNIIHRESGGEPSRLRQWMFRHGVGKSAGQKAFEYLGMRCPQMETAGDITREDVLETFSTYYVPNNMTLIVVGDFDRSEVVARVRETFGTMEGKETPERSRTLPKAIGGKSFRGTMSPIVGSDATVGLCYPAAGNRSPDHFGLKILAAYLNDALYNTIRVEQGLSYSPGAAYFGETEIGIFCAVADVDLDDVEKALEIIKQEIRKVSTTPPDDKKLEDIKRGMLLRLAQLGESNIEYATYYVTRLPEFDREGRYLDHGDRIAAVKPDDLSRIAATVFTDSNEITIFDEPTISYTKLYAALIIGSLLFGAIGWRAYRSYRLRWRRRSRMAHEGDS